jgi:hypothetical protein
MNQRKFLYTLFALLLAVTLWTPAVSQEEPEEPADQNRLHERIRERIRTEEGMEDAQRMRMENQLERALRLGLSDDQVEAMFPMPGPGDMSVALMLKLQQRVMDAAEEGMAAGLLADKMREGRMKGAPEEAIDAAMQQLEKHLAVAYQEMRRAVENGITPHQEEGAELRIQEGLALNMWRGLGEEDLEPLMAQARIRARDGSCTTTELAAAAESATELMEQEMNRERVREMVGTALRQGYTAEEMRQLAVMVKAAHKNGQSEEEVLETVEEQLEEGLKLQEMVQHMIRHRWMGTRDLEVGHGVHSPVDDVIGGPWRNGGVEPAGGESSSGEGTSSQGSGGQGS